jgi:hypothetical protein
MLLLLLQIGNVRDNRFHHRDGTNREVYQGQILGVNLVNNPIHGMLSNNSPLGGAHKTLLSNNKHQAGDKCLLNNNSLLGGAHKTRPRSSLLNNNPPHGMRKTQLNSKRPQDGTHQDRLLNNLLGGTRQMQQVPGDNNRGTRPLLRLMHGLSLSRVLRHGVSKVTNLLHLQHTEVVEVQVSRGHNQHK